MPENSFIVVKPDLSSSTGSWSRATLSGTATLSPRPCTTTHFLVSPLMTKPPIKISFPVWTSARVAILRNSLSTFDNETGVTNKMLDTGLSPIRLVAITEHEYSVLLVSPLTVIGEEDPVLANGPQNAV